MLKCSEAIEVITAITVKACLNSSNCTNTTGTIEMLPSGRESVTATFTNLPENKKYSASVHVLYNGAAVEQQSQPVEISEL